MKKIFAIALALVMVLSMASAFAYCVTDIDWACATEVCNNGLPTVEVVPFVRSNTACAGESEFVQSNCAAAVVGERVYYAVKVTIPADLNKEWYDVATVSVDYSNMTSDMALATDLVDIVAATLSAGDLAYASVKDEPGVYWLTQKGATAATVAWGNGWEKEGAAGVTFGNDNIFYGFAKKSSAKVCVTLNSEVKFNKGDATVVNGYTVTYDGAAGRPTLIFTKDGKSANVYLDADDKVVKLSVDGGFVTSTFTSDGTKFFVANDVDPVDFTCNEYGKFLKKVMDEFKFTFGTCITEKAIKANFGWKSEVKSCTEYKTAAMAVVDADCVVAIPKTGDASVLAWLF